MRLMLRTLYSLFFLLGGIVMSYGQTANFTASTTSGCAPLIVSFSSSGATAYYWDLKNGTTVATSNSSPSTVYTSPGTYAVTLHINSPTGPSVTKNITVYPGPTVNFTYSNASGCAPLTASFVSSVTPGVSGPVTYSWYYGDGFSGAGSTSSHTFTTAGSYSVTLTATNSAGCSNSQQQTNIITVYPKPGGSFTANTTAFCNVPATVQFSNSASNGAAPYSVYWDFGDGNNASSNNPTHTYTSAGKYTVKLLTVDARGCRDTMVRANYIDVHVPNASFSAPTNGCKSRGYLSDSLLFINTTPGGSNTVWNFGDGTSGGGDTIKHAFNDTLAYTVTMITKVGTCYDTARRTIKIYPAPNDVIHFSPRPNCGVPATLLFYTTGTSTSFQWSWAKGGTSTSATPTKTYTVGDLVDTVTVIATDVHGCKDTVSVTDTAHVPWTSIWGPINGCAPLTGTYGAFLKDNITHNGLFPDSAYYYYWDFGDGTTSSSKNPSHTYSNPGTYKLAVKLTTLAGCVVYDTILVHVGTKVTPSFTANPNPVCAGQLVYFTNTTSSPPPGVTYTWDVGDGAYTVVNGTDAIHTYVIPGTYTIKLIITNNGCDDTAQKTNWLVVNGPNANFVDTVLCINQHRTIHVDNQSIGSTSQIWFWGDGTSDTAFEPYHTYTTGGTYNVTLTNYSSVTGCRDTLVIPVTVGPPIMNITALDSTLCLGDTLKLVTAYTGPAWHSMNAYIPRGTTRPDSLAQWTSLNSFYWPVADTGRWSVILVNNINYGNATASNCYDTLFKQNYVIVSKPAAKFKGTPLIGCTPLAVTFTDTSRYTSGTWAASRKWTFGNGNTFTSAAASATQIYPNAGKYTVSLKVTDNNGCTDSITKLNYIEARHPVATFQANTTYGCMGDNFTFLNASTGATGLVYRWTFGDGDSSTAQSPTHAYYKTGSFTVRLIVSDSSGCSDTMTRTGYISITRPKASFTLSDSLTVCPPVTVSFNATSSSANSYEWDFSNGSTAYFATPSSLFMTPGVYKVRLIVTDINGCPDTATASVRVLGYAGALSYASLNGCAPLTVNFLAGITNVPKLVWDFSDGDTALATGATFSHTYKYPGAYVPKLVFYDSKGCSASSTGLDTIKVDDVVAGFKVFPPCERTVLNLIDTSHSLFSPLYSWQWEFGPGQAATGPTVSRVYPSPGQYPVRLIVQNSRGCVDTLKKDITIYPLPIITGSPDTAVCPPDAVAISAIGGVSYQWAPGSSLSCTNCLVPMASPNVPTAYVVIGTDTNGCTNKDTVKIGIQAKTTFTVASGGEICLGQHFQLYAGGATVYHWTPSSSLSNADSAAPVAKPTATTTYIATGKEGSCAADTHMVKVVVNPLPTVDAGTSERMVAGNSVQLQASGTGINRLEWKADSALSCTECYAPYASPKVTTTFYVTAYTNKGCTATDSVTVRVLCDGSQLFIPNTFTPNGDGLNDYFFPRGRGIDVVSSFRVYSRWGELLFERSNMAVNDEYAGWNGTYKGQKLSPDVYVYIIEASCDTGEPIKWKGDVTIMR